MKLLHVDSSPLGTASVSRGLTRDIVARWLATHPGTTVETVDLAEHAPGHLHFNPTAEEAADLTASPSTVFLQKPWRPEQLLQCVRMLLADAPARPAEPA